MADANVPIKFEIYKGDNLVREEVLSQDVIKIGKLASSHLRLDDETVSRMHAVIEASGPDDIHVVDLGSTRGTTVNGERITKARLQPGDEIMFGDCRVVVSFGGDAAQATPAPQAWGGAPQGGYAPPPQQAYAPPPAAYVPPPQQGYAPPSGYQDQAGYQDQQAYAASASYAPPSFAGAPGAGAEVEVQDGSRAMEVQTVFRGVVTGTRHLFNPEGKSTHAQGTMMLYAGMAAGALALLIFVSTAIDVGAEKVQFEAWTAANKDAKAFMWKDRSPVLGGIVLGGAIAGIALSYMGLKRRGKTSPNFLIGSDSDVDAPVSPDYVPSSSHPLVAATGADYVVNVTPRMTGEVYVDNQSYQLQQFIQQRGSSFSLPQDGSARLDCGETTFVVSATAKPRHLEVPFLTWKWDEQVYTVGSAVALGLFLLMIFSVPPDPEVAVAGPLQLGQPVREVPHQAAGGEGRGHPGVAEVEEARRAGRQGQAAQGRRREDGQEDLQEQGGPLRSQGAEGQPGSAPRQEARRGTG